MWDYFRYIIKGIYRTFKSIYFMGIDKFSLRLIYELQRIFDRLMNDKVLIYIYNLNSNVPRLKPEINKLIKKKLLKPYSHSKKNLSLEFKFLNDLKILNFPSKWNDRKWDRLWQFNLHYFDWAKEWLAKSYLNEYWIKESKYLEYLIDDWINNNRIGKGDGWHSYTLSLRIRNLFIIYRYVPSLLSKTRLKSLWIQFLWLNFHQEIFHKGNHYLENLITLCIGGIQFEGRRAKHIYEKSLKKLKEELDNQILTDGGHSERSASYHLLLLEKLIELSFLIKVFEKKIPYWLSRYIFLMKKWADVIKLKKNQYPTFNDCSLDICNSIDLVLKKYKIVYEDSYSKEEKIECLYFDQINPIKYSQSNVSLNKNYSILKDTGWTILRPNKFWEITFKWGLAGFEKSPGHTHADLLSLNLYFKGIPILIESGTSIYKDSKERKFERSSESHNAIQVAKIKKVNKSNSLIWINSLDFWGSFGTGRIPKVINYETRKTSNKFYISASHDGFKKVGCIHRRELIIDLNNENLILEVIDHLYCKYPIYYRLLWHEGVNFNNYILNKIIYSNSDFYEKNDLCKIKTTWLSEGFGLRHERNSLYKKGILKKGGNLIKTSLVFNNKHFNDY